MKNIKSQYIELKELIMEMEVMKRNKFLVIMKMIIDI